MPEMELAGIPDFQSTNFAGGLARPVPATKTSAAARWWPRIIIFVIAGYLMFGRTFAYVGLPGLYPAEVLLAATIFGRYSWVRTLNASYKQRPMVALSIVAFLVWGCFEGVRGYVEGYALIDIAKGIVANYYPLLIFVGIAASRDFNTENLRKSLGLIAVGTSLIPFLMGFVGDGGRTLPWAPSVPLLSGPGLAPFPLFVFIALSSSTSGKWFKFATLLGAVALLVGGRANMVGAAGAVLVLAIIPRRKQMTIQLGAACGLGLVLWLLASPFVPEFGDRTGRPTPTYVAARVISIESPELAVSMAQDAGMNPDFLLVDAGDAEWRRNLWSATIDSLETSSDWILGHGCGPVLGDLLPGTDGSGYGHELRTPHNFAIYLLGYLGIVGCGLFLFLLLSLGGAVMRCKPSPARDAALAGGAVTILMGLAGSVFESPMGAVPAYLTIGILLGVAERRPVYFRRNLAFGARP